MDTSNHLAELLREIRDSQREMLALIKAWQERSEKRHAEWEMDYQAGKNEYENDRAQWQQEHEQWLRHAPMRLVVAIAISTFLFIASVGMAIGIIRSFGWLK